MYLYIYIYTPCKSLTPATRRPLIDYMLTTCRKVLSPNTHFRDRCFQNNTDYIDSYSINSNNSYYTNSNNSHSINSNNSYYINSNNSYSINSTNSYSIRRPGTSFAAAAAARRAGSDPSTIIKL